MVGIREFIIQTIMEDRIMDDAIMEWGFARLYVLPEVVNRFFCEECDGDNPEVCGTEIADCVHIVDSLLSYLLINRQDFLEYFNFKSTSDFLEYVQFCVEINLKIRSSLMQVLPYHLWANLLS
jgi:hypothetical protein